MTIYLPQFLLKIVVFLIHNQVVCCFFIGEIYSKTARIKNTKRLITTPFRIIIFFSFIPLLQNLAHHIHTHHQLSDSLPLCHQLTLYLSILLFHIINQAVMMFWFFLSGIQYPCTNVQCYFLFFSHDINPEKHNSCAQMFSPHSIFYAHLTNGFSFVLTCYDTVKNLTIWGWKNHLNEPQHFWISY